MIRRIRSLFAAGLLRWQGRASLVLSIVVVLLVSLAAVAYAGVPSADPVNAVHVDVIGDSLSTGYKTPGNTWPGQAEPIAAGMGLKVQITNASENGAGYVQPGDMGDVFLDLANRIVNSQSQVVVLFGSDNDSGDPGIAGAVKQALARVKVLAPDASVIVVGPTSESDDPQGQLTQIRQVLSQQAAAVGAQFVDPVALGWFQGAAAQNLTSDLEHPNAAGESYLAKKMIALMVPVIKSAMLQDLLKRTRPVEGLWPGPHYTVFHKDPATLRWLRPKPGPAA